MAGKGGATPGAGRKRKADKFATPISKAEQRIVDRLPELVDLAFERAYGVKVKEGDVVYTTPPDLKAIIYLIDRIMGKPTERHEVSGEDGEPLKVYVTLGPDDL